MTTQTGAVVRSSKLMLPGYVLVAMGVALPRFVHGVAEALQPSLLRALLFIGTDVFRLCFFVGVVFLIIGALRNRRWKREAEQGSGPT